MKKIVDVIIEYMDQDPYFSPCRAFFDQEEVDDGFVAFMCYGPDGFYCRHYEKCPHRHDDPGFDPDYQAKYAHACGYHD
jgi:hypothetical protein